MLSRGELVELVVDLKFASEGNASSTVNNFVTYSILPQLEPRKDAGYPDWAVCVALNFLVERQTTHGPTMRAYTPPNFVRPLWLLHDLKLVLNQLDRCRFLSGRAAGALLLFLQKTRALFVEEDAAEHIQSLEELLSNVAKGQLPPGIAPRDVLEHIRQAILDAERNIENAKEKELAELLPKNIRNRVWKALGRGKRKEQ